MKKVLKWLLIIFASILMLMIVIPMAYKGKIMKIARQEANKNLLAVVNFDDISLSMFKCFPKLHLSVYKLNIKGVNEFANDTLLDIPVMNLSINLASLFGDQIEITGINIENPYLGIKILKGGAANYDIVPADTIVVAEEEVADDDTTSGFKMELQEFTIRNARVVYDDIDFDMAAVFDGFNLDMTGDLTASTTDLNLKSTIGEFTFTMEGLDYLSKAKIILDAGIFADLDNWVFTFKDNYLDINDLKLNFEGSVDIADSVMIGMDLKFKSPQNTFKSLLSLVPAVYARDFEGLVAKGDFVVDGFAKGQMDYDVTVYPEFLLNLEVKNGFFQYPDLPKSVENVNIATKVSSIGGPMDNIVVDISKFHIELAQNPLEMSLHLAHPETDMEIKGKIDGKIDFSSLNDVIPLDSMSIAGLMEMNLVLGGRMSSIEKEQYEDFTADGNVKLSNFAFTMPDVPEVKISEANLQFSPKFVDLSKFDMLIGRSDIHLQGKVENFVPYAFADGVLSGKLSLQSALFDANEFLTGEETPEAEAEMPEDSSALEAFQIPENIDFVFKADMKRVLYDNMKMTNAEGLVSVSKGKLGFDKFFVEMLGGSILITGFYEAIDLENPNAAFEFGIKNISISETYKTFNTVKQMAPIARYANGNIGMSFRMDTRFDHFLNPKYNSLNAAGTLNTQNVGIENNALFTQIADKLKYEKLRNPKVSDVDLAFSIENGNLEIKPFDAKLAGHKATIGGNQQLGGEIDYFIKAMLPAGKITQSLTKLSGQDLNKDIEFTIGIGGTLKDPKISSFQTGAGESVKELAKEEIKKELSTEALKLVEDARQKTAQMMLAAEKQAENIRKSAKDAREKIIVEADKQGKKLIAEAGANPLKKKLAEESAKKLNSEAKEKAQKLEKEADDKASALLEKTKNESDELIQNAEKKAQNL
jgi:hypothetical protein